jgi:predicted RNase H-like nuclease (RuvC/YqgF family)
MAQTVSLVHPQRTLQVSAKLLVQKCDLFGDDPTLTAFPYKVTSEVSLTDFRAFISALEGRTVTMSNGNIRGLTRLSEELHFRELSAQVSQFRESEEFKEEVTQEDLETRKRLAALEERMQQRDREIAALQTELSQQQHNQEAVLGRVARLEADVLALHTAPA